MKINETILIKNPILTLKESFAFKFVLSEDCVLEAWPRVKDELEEKAERVAGILGLAKHHLIIQVFVGIEGVQCLLSFISPQM